MTIAERKGRTDPVERRPTPRSAVAVWINGRRAIVASATGHGSVLTCEIERGVGSEARYLAVVVRAMGDAERVAILGPGSTRLELERAYVSIHHRPERLVDVESAGAVTTDEVTQRVRELVG